MSGPFCLPASLEVGLSKAANSLMKTRKIQAKPPSKVPGALAVPNPFQAKSAL
jgi:hypothetical protein